MIVTWCWRSGKVLLIQSRQYDSMPFTRTKIVLLFISKTHSFRIVKRMSLIT